MWEKKLFNRKKNKKTKQNKLKKKNWKLIKMIMEALLAAIVITRMKIGNNSKLGHEKKKQNNYDTNKSVNVNIIIQIKI